MLLNLLLSKEIFGSASDSVLQRIDYCFGLGVGYSFSEVLPPYNPRLPDGYNLIGSEVRYHLHSKGSNHRWGTGFGILHMRNLPDDPVDYSPYGGNYRNDIKWITSLMLHKEYALIDHLYTRLTINLGGRLWFEKWYHDGTFDESGFVIENYATLENVLGFGIKLGIRQDFVLNDHWDLSIQGEVTPLTAAKFSGYIRSTGGGPVVHLTDEQYIYDPFRLYILAVGMSYKFYTSAGN